MIKKLLLVSLFLVAGVVVGLWFQGVSITGLFGNIFTFAQTQLQPATTFIQQNAPFIGVGFTALTTAGALIIRKLTKAKDAMAAQAESWRNEAFQTNEAARQIQQKKEELDEQFTTFQEQTKLKIDGLEAQLSAKDELIEQQRREIEKIRAEANALSHISEERIAEKVAQMKEDASRAP